jgi:uncharacterized protein
VARPRRRGRARCVLLIAASVVLALPIAGGSPARAAPGDDVDSAIGRGDYAGALRLARPRAEQGDVGAEYQLGALYQNGQGVPKDDVEAAKWFRKAALEGHAGARYQLGVMYLNGRGVSQNHAEASRWLRLAAGQGVAAAQVDIGILYAHGVGVRRDPALAHAWFTIAASLAETTDPALRAQAVRERDAIGATMTPAQLDESRKFVATFRLAP